MYNTRVIHQLIVMVSYRVSGEGWHFGLLLFFYIHGRQGEGRGMNKGGSRFTKFSFSLICPETSMNVHGLHYHHSKSLEGR